MAVFGGCLWWLRVEVGSEGARARERKRSEHEKKKKGSVRKKHYFHKLNFDWTLTRFRIGRGELLLLKHLIILMIEISPYRIPYVRLE